MPTLPNMGLITPTQGGDSGTWDDKINAAFVQVDAHDHTSGKGVLVPVAGLNINANLPMGGFNLTGIGTLDFTAIAAPSSGSKRIFVNTSDNELYWRSNAGVNVKITNGASLNITLVGGIVGDYSSVGAQVAFDDANDRYTFKQNSATGWARMASGEVRIYETGTSDSVYVGHAAPAALGVSYTVTWPLGLSGQTGPVVIDTAGIITFPGLQTLSINPGAFGAGSNCTTANGFVQMGTGGLGNVIIPVTIPEGRKITGWTVRYKKNSSNATTIHLRLFKAVDGALTPIGSDQTDSTNAPGTATGKSDTFAAQTIGSGETYHIRVNNDVAPSASDEIYNCQVTYTY